MHRVTAASAIVRDVSEGKRAEQELTRLYEQERHTALTLQRSLMGRPAEVPGLDVASRYLPAGHGPGVGGDWFDVLSLDGGRVGLFIGDVMGRGLAAATVMGQLRAAAHALARAGLPPIKVMRALDLIVGDLPDQMATCSYLLADPAAGTLCVCSAGHMPAIVIHPDGSVRRLPAPVNLPLGVGPSEGSHRHLLVPFAPGSTLVLYTDGLVEIPHGDIDKQIKTLETELESSSAAGTGLEETADRVLATLLAGTEERPDDVTLLLARLPAPPLDEVTITLPGEPEAVAKGRGFLLATLTGWGEFGTDTAETARLLVSEILTNAVRHAPGSVELRIRRDASRLTAEVTDRSTELPEPRRTTATDEAGRGLVLVEAFAEEWGTRPGNYGKTVWFTLAV